MSWIGELSGGKKPAPYVSDPSEEKVADPNIAGRMVTKKSANQPFLKYQEYREEQKALHEAWLEKKKIRDAKIAKGEPVGPLEPDPTEPTEVGIVGLLKFLVVLLICIALAGKFFTGSYTWENRSKWLQLQTYMPTDQRLFSEIGLKEYNGDGRPLYLAIDGDVYDVSSGKAYQPGGSYHHFVGTDAARAFATGCFKEHKTHDIRGLNDDELRGLAHWKKFYAEHKDYRKVGRVSHRPIDPSIPPPEHCDPKKAQKARERAAAAKKAADRTNHEEL
ncbi:hypothetical protein D9619_001068 [Psilocybe cf. subviscida]|uniref:Cytochrome b5 heme-binding domain-containing protein n=1 Tax=Psilocybe cf. subviscida TaxID=2480587 RepID=A0A8H5BEC9_9AGAR|nr:hypothetical protein D9619_001068 [Psilocybe cf. subviscida]